jgi:predicted kinase
MSVPKRVILLQGAPGCGKSTMAEILAEHYRSRGATVEIHSADKYWYEVVEPDQPHKYSWNTEMSGKNHVWNQRNVLAAMERGVDVIIVDNTNTLRKEAAPYVVLAKMFGYSIDAVRVDPGVNVCVARNEDRPSDRQVPEEVVRAMHARMENLLPLFDA